MLIVTIIVLVLHTVLTKFLGFPFIRSYQCMNISHWIFWERGNIPLDYCSQYHLFHYAPWHNMINTCIKFMQIKKLINQVIKINGIKQEYNVWQNRKYHITKYTLAHCTVLHCTALYCTVLHCTARYCTVLHGTALYCTVLHCTARYCTVLHCTALYCTVLHCTALYCTVMHCTAQYCTVLHGIALYICTLYRMTTIQSWSSREHYVGPGTYTCT
jgi:hypothetical protein